MTEQHNQSEQMQSRPYHQARGILLNTEQSVWMGPNPHAFGHHGFGGSVGTGDPTPGLAPIVMEVISASVEALRRSGELSLLIAEQNTTFASCHADRIYLIEHGAIEWSGGRIGLQRKPARIGLVTLQPDKGLSVAVATPEVARLIYEARAALEGLAARLFARNASDAEVKALRQSVNHLADVYEGFSADAFIAAKTRFYDILLQGAGNEIAADTLSSAEPAKQSIRELREFLDALEARDEELAYRLCVAHIEAAATAALKSFGSASVL